ncbi:LysR family transcriptional regulator [Actinomadura madurae]|uniref:LysR family transcriptional regulator n=1 Tax=Actinomadura madurae TaxID=1993 RepID=UPI002025D145|nr:LysR substrate-binding domain-containing protein [Actinomadura madurae]URM96960.1 LysR family transcriptional regulator [Actinomadura madurae]URN07742.1 LysR family transcriptional regulator [Actinomadura madurae]
MLDIVRLRVLAAIAAEGSVTKAAKHLNYSQPAVSRHLARLEAETGARLVQRAGRGIRLTPEGEHLARRATEIVGRVDTAAAELSALVGLHTGLVRVAGFQSALAALVPHAAGTLRREHPGLELRLIESHPRVALDLLRAGEVDIAVAFRYDDPVPDDVRAAHLFDDPMYLLSLDPGQTLEGNRDSDWIAGCENCRREFLEACDKAGFTPPIAYTADDIIVNQALVAAGMGVTTMPGLALRTHRAPGIEASVLRDFQRHVYLATYGDPPDPPATTAFIAALHHAVQQIRPGEPLPPAARPSQAE